MMFSAKINRTQPECLRLSEFIHLDNLDLVLENGRTFHELIVERLDVDTGALLEKVKKNSPNY